MALIENEKIFVGTQFKLNLHVEPVADMTMDDYDFSVEVYCSRLRIEKREKKDCTRVDSDNYLVTVDSAVLGAGTLKVKFTAIVPDIDFPDELRKEVTVIDTDIEIEK